jgi:hypothetical protein
MWDADLSMIFPLLLLIFIYAVAYVGVVYEFIFFCRHAHRPDNAWRHIFETVILIGGSGAWLHFDDQWPWGFGKWQPTLPVAGTVVLIAYLYSSYRKRALGLWVEVPVQVCLGGGVFIMTLFTLWMPNSRGWMEMGLPVDLLFAMTILTNYQKWRLSKMK